MRERHGAAAGSCSSLLSAAASRNAAFLAFAKQASKPSERFVTHLEVPRWQLLLLAPAAGTQLAGHHPLVADRRLARADDVIFAERAVWVVEQPRVDAVDVEDVVAHQLRVRWWRWEKKKENRKHGEDCDGLW